MASGLLRHEDRELKHQHHIGKDVRSGDSHSAALPSIGSLPEELLQDASRRLGLSGLIYALVYILAFYGPGITGWIREGVAPEHLYILPDVLSNLFILMGFVVWFAVRHLKVEPRRLLDLGLVFQVVSTLGIGLPQIWGAFPVYDPGLFDPDTVGGIPWECVWILSYPMIAPNTPWKSLTASLISAAMPLSVLTLSRFYGPTDPNLPMGMFIVYYLFTTFVCALLALVSTRITFRYGGRLLRAQEMGRYRLTRLIGKGGMGEVWEAEHRMLARTTAMKLIRPETLAGTDAARRMQLRRFEREARATAALHSVHSIDIYDFGLTPDGSFYYVMELLEGMDLESFVKRFGPVNPGRAIHWLRQICHALMDAHDRGLIHRDLKPANLFLCRLGPDCDFIKVLDYGLVKDHEGEAEGETRLTREGISFGTPAYMAPEMAMGPAAADALSDIYALGCIAYKLLTGIPVFTGETALATVLMHVKDEPISPSLRSELPLPADLEAVVLGCLNKEPAQRPASAAALDALLASCADAGSWGNAEACEWWSLHLPASPVHGLPRATGPTERGI